VRCVVGSARFAGAFVFGALVLGLFLLPDYIVRYASSEPAAGLFVGSLLGLAALFGCSLALARAGRAERWTLDPKGGALVVERANFGRRGVEEAIDLQYVEALSFVRRSAPLTSTLEVVFEDGQTLSVLSAPAVDGSWDVLAAALQKFVAARRMDLEIRIA